MTNRKTRVILRVLAELVYEELSPEPDKVKYLDYGSPSRVHRLYGCFQYLCNAFGDTAPDTMMQEEFLSMFADISLDTALREVSNMSRSERTDTGNYILQILANDIVFGAFLFYNDFMIVKSIIANALIQNEQLDAVCRHSVELEMYK